MSLPSILSPHSVDGDASSTARVVPHRYLAKTLWLYASICHVLPLTGAVVAMFLLPWIQPGVIVGVLFAIFWALTLGVGISVGFHRLFSHRAFTAYPEVRVPIAILGSMAGQGPLIAWVALHRCHHQYSDRIGDPHSPWPQGNTVRESLRGFWHSHFGWVLCYDMPDPLFYCPDLVNDRLLSRTSRLFLVWFLLGLILPPLLAGLLIGTWESALAGFLWAGCVRVALTSQVTWCINSICHLFGRHPHDTGDHSKNLAWLAIPSFGESWHNNHHAFPGSAAFGHRVSQIDLGYIVIRILQKMRVVQNVKTPALQDSKKLP